MRKFLNENRKYLSELKYNLKKKYATGPYKEWNASRIDYVIDNVLKKQMKEENEYELKVFNRLVNKLVGKVEYQAPLPILSEGGRLEHLYIADILVNDHIIIEVDGRSHENQEKQLKDFYRDEQTSQAGYITRRVSTQNIKAIDDIIAEFKESHLFN